MYINKIYMSLIFFIIFLFTTSVAASVSPYVNFQGFITNSNGEAITDDSYSMTFSLWDGENEDPPNNLLWTQTQILPVERGIYSISLGPFPYTVTFAEQYYISIQIEGGDYLKINNSFIPVTSTWTAFRASTSGGRLVNSVSSDYSITDMDDIVLASGATTITLPQADSFHYRIFTIKKTDSSNTLSIATISNETIDGIDRSNGSPITITEQYDEMSFVSDGQNWLSIHKAPNYGADNGLTLDDRTLSIQQEGIDSAMIANGAITTSKISDGTITGSDLNATLDLSTVSADVLSVTTTLNANTVSLTSLTVWGVATLNTLNAESANLTALSLGEATIAVANPANAKTITIPDSTGIFVVTSDGSFSVTSTDIQSSAVITSKIADNAITTSKISDGTITGSDLNATLDLSTVSADVLSVTTTLNANTVSLTSLTVWGVATLNTLNAESANLTALSLGEATIAVANPANAKTITIPDTDGIFVVTSDGSYSVTSTDIQDSAVTTNKIADNAVTSSKISDGTVTGNDLNSTLSLSNVSASALTISNAISGNTASLTELTVYGFATMNTIDATSITVTGQLILPDYNVSAISDGQITWDATNDKLYVGTSSGTTKINNTFTTYSTTADSANLTVTCGIGTASGGGCSSDSAQLNETYPTCSGAKCTNNVTTQDGWHCTFSASDASNSAFVICAD
ncbi:conserved hypothetical protein, secreted [Candidatus Magnetomorum sp. HK-1]|nr:conserved hypothetical protein, secreted [Candidatus Magnetomorum sp. HK-1]